MLDLSDTEDSTTPSIEELPMGRHTGDMLHLGRVVTDINDQLVSCNDKHTHQTNTTERAAELISPLK